LNKERCEVTAFERQRVIILRRWYSDDQVYAIFNYSSAPASTALSLPRGNWQKILDSADPRWLGPGTILPPELDSDGLLTLPLNGRSFILLVNDAKKI
jgi:maltooligosyltrehalose trehalohydrolase